MDDRRKNESDDELWAMTRGRFWNGAWVYAAAIGVLVLVSVF
jgi:hypothetical protein